MECHKIHFSSQKILETVYAIALSPLVSNDDGCVDGAGEGDVVEGVEQLGEDVGVQGCSVSQGPLPNWDRTVC